MPEGGAPGHSFGILLSCFSFDALSAEVLVRLSMVLRLVRWLEARKTGCKPTTGLAAASRVLPARPVDIKSNARSVSMEVWAAACAGLTCQVACVQTVFEQWLTL